MINLNNFFKPKSVVIVGVSRNPNKVGHVLFRNLLDGGYQGDVYIVNRSTARVLDFKCYKSVLKINKKIDLAIISVPAKFVLDIVKECNKKKIKDVLIITSGFAEVGDIKLENKLREFVNKNKMRMIGPNCLGILDPSNSLDTLFLPRYRMKRPDAGGISFVCQSGAIGSTILDLATEMGHKFAKFVSYGNATTIDESDIIEYLGEDKDTKVICLYVEAVRDGRKFIEVMNKVTKKKPVVVIKGGMTEEGNKATLSHTGSLAGSVEVYFGVFKQVGIIRADNLNEMLNYASVFEKLMKPKGNRVQVITNGGGFGILSADAISLNKNLEMAKLSSKSISGLKKKLSKLVSLSNPLDLVGDASTESYKLALEYCMDDKNIDAILLIVLYQTPLITTDIVDVISEMNELKKKPIIVVSAGGEFTEVLSESLESNGMVTFTFPEEAVKSMSALVEYYVKD